MVSYLKQYNEKVYLYLLIFVAILIPSAESLPVKLASFSVILLTLLWLILGNYKQKLERLKNNKLLWLFMSLFLINLPGLLRTDYPVEANELLIRKLPLLLFPLIIGTSVKLSHKQIHLTIIAFITSLFIVSLFTFREGITVLLDREDLTTMVRLTVLHRPYSGLLSAFAVIALIDLFRYYHNNIVRFVVAIGIVYFIFFIYILYAKMIVIALGFLLIMFVTISSVKKFGKYIVIAAGFLLLFSAAWYISTNIKAKTVLHKIIKFEDFSYQEYDIHLVSSINIRYINWGCSIEVLKQEQNWLTGLGIGNAQEQLNLCYKGLNPWIYESKMNAHNDYLEEMLRNGLPGLLIFILGLAIPAVLSIRNNNYLYLSFIILFAICCITENLLSRQVGIMYYALFNSIFAFNCQHISQFKYENKDVYTNTII